MKIKTIRFTTAFPVIGQQFDESDASDIDVEMYPHAIRVTAVKVIQGTPTKFRLYVPWQQIMFIREDI